MPRLKGSHRSGISSTYLAGQGIVFTIESSPFSQFHWNSQMIDVPGAPEAPVAPVAPQIFADGDFEMEFYDDENIKLIIKEGMEQAEDIIEIVREHYQDHREMARELKQQERELAREVRSLEREVRDLEYRERRADMEEKSEKAALEKEKTKLKKEMAKLAEEKQKLAAQAQKYQAEVQKRKQEKQQQKQRYYSNVEASITESLCHFGNGLRELPNGEHVNVIIKNGGDQDSKRPRDKILVFTKADIRNCSLEKISEKELMAKAKSYQY